MYDIVIILQSQI